MMPTAAVFEHEMLREIYQQPAALADTIERYAPNGKLATEVFQPVAEALQGRERLVIAASGSSRHAGLAAEIMLEDLAGLIVDVEYASEYVYRSTHTLQDPGVLVISQSGETADTLAGLREAKARGLPTLAITNNARSTMAQEADASLPTCAGTEKAIPATKSFTTQLVVLYSLALYLARIRGRMTSPAVERHVEDLRRLPQRNRAPSLRRHRPKNLPAGSCGWSSIPTSCATGRTRSISWRISASSDRASSFR